jgi:PAS domain S-box-containing protein
VDVTDLHRAQNEVKEKENHFRQVLEALPAAVYTTDQSGKITYYNRAAADLAGRNPEIGKDEWCVSFRLYNTDGKLMPHDQCPMAVALRENRPVRGREAMAQRPDGTLFPFLPFPTPIHNAGGELIGAVNMMVDISERKNAEAQQKILLDELNHRVKNNMQLLQALLQIAQRGTQNEEARAVLADATRRVAAMAAAQQVLYSSASASSFSGQEFLKSVCTSAQHASRRTSL